MALIASVFILVAILALFAAAAQRWGVDSRDTSREASLDSYRPYLITH